MEKSREYFSPRNTHRTLAQKAPDAVPVRPVSRQPGSVRVRHRIIGTGRSLECPVV